MKLSYYNFNLPSELIAEKPSKQRDECRMMVLHRDTKTIEHRLFKDIIEYLNEGDVVVANNTKVFPALLYGEKEKTGAKITVFLQRELNRDMRLWDVIVDPARKIRIGNKLYFGPNESLVAEVIDNTTSRGRTVRFLFDGTHEEFVKHIRSLGHTPLPDELQALRNIENWDCGSTHSGSAFQSRTAETLRDKRRAMGRDNPPLRHGQLQRDRGGRPLQAPHGRRRDACVARDMRCHHGS